MAAHQERYASPESCLRLKDLKLFFQVKIIW
jgi:hypothetical protein